jgi:hypothetical protein
MGINADDSQVIKLKHSSIGIIAFVLFLSPIIPGTLLGILFLLKKAGFYISVGLPSNILGFLFDFASAWIFLALLAGLILSIIDLTKPNRKRVLPLIIITAFGLMFIAAIVSAYLDIARIANG